MKKSVLAVFATVLLALSFQCEALTFNPFKRAGRVKASSLLITGNFTEARLLAELAQYYSKQPLIIVSPDVDGGSQMFFLPASNKAEATSTEDFMEILTYINPKQVIVLGGSDYVPKKFVDLARTKYPILSLDGDDWSSNASALEQILKLNNLRLKFDNYKANLKAADKN